MLLLILNRARTPSAPVAGKPNHETLAQVADEVG
jgi:hypothetical protein